MALNSDMDSGAKIDPYGVNMFFKPIETYIIQLKYQDF